MNIFLILTTISSSVLAFKDVEFDGKIIDGMLINITEVPWVTSIYTAVGRIDGRWVLRFTCAGTIIGRNEIITAEHCIPRNRRPDSKIFFRAGSANRELGRLQSLDFIRYHPLQNPFSPSYDVAFVRVKEPFEFSENLRPIRIRSSEPKSGSVVMLAGWGKTKPKFDPSDTPPKELRAVNLTMWDKDDCYSKFNISLCFFQYSEVLKCMKNIGEGSGKSGCKGDSGSGVVYQNKLVGVLSGGITSVPLPPSEISCNAPNVVNVYNSAVKIKAWIRKMINESEKLGKR